MRSGAVRLLQSIVLSCLVVSCGLQPSNQGPPEGAPAPLEGALRDGQDTPSTETTLLPEAPPEPPLLEDWGTSEDHVISSSDQEITLTGTGRSYTVHRHESVVSPDGLLSVVVDFSVEDATVDTLFTLGMEGRDGQGKKFFHGVRVRHFGSEAFVQGPNGNVAKRLQFAMTSKETYRMELVFYRDGSALYLGTASPKRYNPNHVFHFPVPNSQLQFMAKIYRGKGTVKSVTMSQKAPNLLATQAPTLMENGGPLNPDGLLRTLVTRTMDLSLTWSGYLAPRINPFFYNTTLDDMPAEYFFGTGYEWSVLGGRTTEARDQKKVIRFRFNTLEAETKNARLLVQGKDANKNSYSAALILTGGNSSILVSAPGHSANKPLNLYLLPNTDYVADFLATSDGTALYVYPAGDPLPVSPAHVIVSSDWGLSPRAMIHRGTIRLDGVDTLLDAQAYPDLLAPFAADADLHPSTWMTMESGGRWVTFQRVVPETYGAEVGDGTLRLSGAGTAYEQYISPDKYARVPENSAEGYPNKGLRFEFKLKKGNVDPIFHLAVEGKSDVGGYYRRHGIVMRHDRIYAQFSTGIKTEMSTYVLSGAGATAPNASLTNFDPRATYVMKIEVYPDGSAIYLWKKGEPEPTEPEHVLMLSDFSVYNWHAWIWRDTVDVTFEEYDTSKSLVTETFVKGDAHTTWVTDFYNVLSKEAVMTTADGVGPFDEDGNFVLTGTGVNWSATMGLPDELSRADKFRVGVKVKVDTAVTAHSGMHFGVEGNSPEDPFGRRYRRHAVVFWKDEIYAQSFADGIDDWRGSMMLPEVKANTWYNIEILGNRSGTALSVWEDGQVRPAKPQSILHSTDWVPKIRLWVYNGNATFKDFTVSHLGADEADWNNISQFSDADNLTHQRYATITDYMGAGYFPGLFSVLGQPTGADRFTAIANFDFAAEGFPCWQEVDSALGAPDSDGYRVIRGDGQRYWEGVSCLTALKRENREGISAEFVMPHLTHNALIGLQGYVNGRYRRHALKLVRGGGGKVKVTAEAYTATKGWVKTEDWGNVPPGGRYRVSFATSPEGSTLALEDLDTQQSFVPDTFTRAEYPGLNGAVDSSAADWDPHFFIRIWRDELKIRSIQ